MCGEVCLFTKILCCLYIKSDVMTTVSNAYECSHEQQQLYTRHKTSLVSTYFVFALTLVIDTGGMM